MNRPSKLYRVYDGEDSNRDSIDSLRDQIENLKEQVASQQQMLESTTRFLIGTQERLEYKKAELEIRNRELFESINYANYVQSALIPNADKLKPYFNESFISLKQKDTIGGDLPYFHSQGDVVLVAAVDCTGHGVSGAMLTALAHSYLNEIFSGPSKLASVRLDRVLSILNKYFMGVFGKHDYQLFGLDIAMLKLNVQTREAEFAGAGRPMLILRDGKLERIQKTGLGIGLKSDQKFTSEKFHFQPDDKFYLYSDGIVDQFGDRSSKKFSDRRLRELIMETGHLKLLKQSEIVFDFLRSWQGDNEQTDDQLLIGLKAK